MSFAKSEHVSVMLEECLKFFSAVELKVFFEGTVGAGGHAKAILEAHPEIELYIGCDRDPEALKIAKSHLEPWKDKVELVKGNFADLDEILEERKIKQVDGFFLT
jgi:16S rRNA (cytosine1402-N4)-methyltransferase